MVGTLLSFFNKEDNSIYINKNVIPNIQTFAIAHKIGHYVLDREYLFNDLIYKPLEEKLIYNPITNEDYKANIFAKNLLMPKFMLDKYKQIANKEELSKIFMFNKQIFNKQIF